MHAYLHCCTRRTPAAALPELDVYAESHRRAKSRQMRRTVLQREAARRRDTPVTAERSLQQKVRTIFSRHVQRQTVRLISFRVIRRRRTG